MLVHTLAHWKGSWGCRGGQRRGVTLFILAAECVSLFHCVWRVFGLRVSETLAQLPLPFAGQCYCHCPTLGASLPRTHCAGRPELAEAFAHVAVSCVSAEWGPRRGAAAHSVRPAFVVFMFTSPTLPNNERLAVIAYGTAKALVPCRWRCFVAFRFRTLSFAAILCLGQFCFQFILAGFSFGLDFAMAVTSECE